MISSRVVSIAGLYEQGIFSPANVQREFQWNEKQRRVLLNDLLSAFDRCRLDPGEAMEAAATETPSDLQDAPEDDASADAVGDVDAPLAPSPIRQTQRRQPGSQGKYYLGTMVLRRSVRAQNHYDVYDGLQRLTTLTILLANLKRSIGADHPAAIRRIDTMLFEPHGDRRLEVPTPGASLSSIVAGKTLQNRDKLVEADLLMRETNDDFMKSFRRGWSDERRTAFLDFLCDRVELVLIEVEDTTLAHQIFVASNARGMKLPIGDNLKGLLTEQLKHAGATRAEIDELGKTWRRIQRRLGNSFDDFLKAVETIRYPRDFRYTPGELLFDEFSSQARAQELRPWLEEDFLRMADEFASTRNHRELEHLRGLELARWQLSFLSWKEWQPFYIVMGLAQIGRPPAEKMKRTQQLLRAGLIVELIEMSERTRRVIFAKAIDQMQTGHDPFALRNSDASRGALMFKPELVEAARTRLRGAFDQPDRRRAIVRWLETLHWDGSVPRSAAFGVNVEHVLPRKALGAWPQAFTQDQHERCINRLGNLCLLPISVNDELGNADWPDKADAYVSCRTRNRSVGLVLDTANTRPGGPAWTSDEIDRLTEQLAQTAERVLHLSPGRRRAGTAPDSGPAAVQV